MYLMSYRLTGTEPWTNGSSLFLHPIVLYLCWGLLEQDKRKHWGKRIDANVESIKPQSGR